MPTSDVAIVGARAAGAATALLLARAGHRVTVVDRAAYGSDTLSTHALMRGGVVQLERWGLLDRIIEAGTPPVRRVTFDYGGTPTVIDLDRPLYAPRRTLLDRVLVDAARGAGAQIRFGTRATGLLRGPDGRVEGIAVTDAGGRSDRIDAMVTVGADGIRSQVARWVDARVRHVARRTTASFYGYWEDVEATGYEWNYTTDLASGLIPTNDGRVCVFVSVSPERFERELRHDRDASVPRALREAAPALAERLAEGRRHGPLRGFPGLPGWLRSPFGRGWALVGDAGYWKDPLTAHGLTDALRDAELLARALDAGLTDDAPMTMMAALAGYEQTRDRLSLPLLRMTDEVAGFAWSLPRLQQLHLDLSRTMQHETRFVAQLDPWWQATRRVAALA